MLRRELHLPLPSSTCQCFPDTGRRAVKELSCAKGFQACTEKDEVLVVAPHTLILRQLPAACSHHRNKTCVETKNPSFPMERTDMIKRRLVTDVAVAVLQAARVDSQQLTERYGDAGLDLETGYCGGGDD